jgi:hypothetical protein
MKLPLTTLDLGFVLECIVSFDTLEELLLTPGWVHVLHTHMDALGNDPSIHLCQSQMQLQNSGLTEVRQKHSGIDQL